MNGAILTWDDLRAEIARRRPRVSVARLADELKMNRQTLSTYLNSDVSQPSTGFVARATAALDRLTEAVAT